MTAKVNITIQVRNVLKDLVRAAQTKELRGVLTAKEIAQDLQGAALLYIRSLVRDRDQQSARDVRAGVTERLVPAFIAREISTHIQKRLLTVAREELYLDSQRRRPKDTRNIFGERFPRDIYYKRPENVRMYNSMQGSRVAIRTAQGSYDVQGEFSIQSTAPHAALVMGQAPSRIVLAPRTIIREIDLPRKAWMVFRMPNGKFFFISRPKLRKNISRKRAKEVDATNKGKITFRIGPSIRIQNILRSVFRVRAKQLAELAVTQDRVHERLVKRFARAHSSVMKQFDQRSPFVSYEESI